MRDALTSAELLVLAGDGDRPAFVALWDDFGGPVLALASRVLGSQTAAEDATVEIFRTAWRAAATYEPERLDVTDWLFEIARAVLRDSGRALRQEAAQDELELLRVHVAIAALPSRERIVIEHMYGGHCSQREIAARTGWSLGTVKTRTRNAVAHLADELADVEAEL